ncbi:MAG: polysaccharide pyruvyl transferase family protein [Clostridia bacterium]|nr:polysaccharide pyruvyl transferase family protein [Clostridia bacterium]
MKIGILTHHKVSSHGALLQMYGLQQVLQGLGHQVVILDYERNLDFIDETTRKRFSAGLSNLSYYLRSYLVENGPGMLLYQYKKQKVLGGFRGQHFTQIPYVNSQELDAVVVGADEVFSLENGVNFMMYGHGITSRHVLSYAPSFGQTDVDRIRRFGCERLISSGLEGFTALSVRDAGSQAVIRHLLGKEAPLVCDPALLWDFGRIEKQPQKEKYIVVYSYQSNFKEEARIAAIRAYAKKKGCRLWSVGVYYKWCDRRINCTPMEMLQIFANAEAVITDTFHGTISSYIARTPVAVFVRENNNVKLGYLLKQLGYEDRQVTAVEQLESVLAAPPHFEEADRRVASLRKAGMSYLTEALQLCEE